MCLRCGEAGCSFVFSTYFGYQRHLSRAHKDGGDSDSVSDVEFGPATNVGSSVSQQVNVDPPATVTTHIPMDKTKILDMCSSVIAQLQASGVPESTVQCLVGSMEELVDDIHAHAKETVVESLSSDASCETLKKVQDCFGQLENPFSSINTESKRKKHLENSGTSGVYSWCAF